MTGIGGHQSPTMDTDVWLTPPDILAALGEFDLDPAACAEPRPWPTAKQHYTIHENGLKKPWHGRVWLNPPYGGPTIVGPWMRRMASHNRGTVLIFARTETAVFFDTVWRKATACLFIEGRLHFHYPDGRRAKNNAGGPSVLIAYGEHDAAILRASKLPGHFVSLAPAITARAAA
jgi:hypothetical protein